MNSPFDKFTDMVSYCYRSSINPFGVLLRHVYHRIVYRKNLFTSSRVILKGIGKLKIPTGPILIGVKPVGFQTKYDATLINCRGSIEFEEDFSIGRGCRFDVGPDAKVKLGAGSFLSVNCLVVIMHGLKIGRECKISWNCQFLDDDFHSIVYPDAKWPLRGKRKSEICIGDHVWIGCNATILKGVIVANNCVIAAHSVVKGDFLEEGCLIAGNPAVVVRRGVVWN